MSTIPPTTDADSGSLILRTVVGDTYIQLGGTDVKTVGSEDPLHYHEVAIHFGDSICSVKGILLAFNSSDGGAATTLCDNLSLVSSPYVMNVYGCLEGTKERCHQIFLVLPFFDKTFASFIEPDSKMTAENGRFSEAFIHVIQDVIKGLFTLHNKGFYCPRFTGKHVAVITEMDDHINAKIWNFCLAENKLALLEDWDRLADKIEEAAKNHNIYAAEIEDLCMRMRNGELRGLDILKHSALLSTSKKFDQILAVNAYVATFCRYHQQNPHANDPSKTKVHSDLVNYMSQISNWVTQDMPEWIKNIKFAEGRPIPCLEDGDHLVSELRTMVEHGNRFIPPPKPVQPIQHPESDLEEEFRNAWSEHLLKIHSFATALELKY